MEQLLKKAEELEKKINRRWDLIGDAENNGQYEEAQRLGEDIMDLQNEIQDICIKIENIRRK